MQIAFFTIIVSNDIVYPPSYWPYYYH